MMLYYINMRIPLSLLWGIYLEMELLDHIILCLIILRIVVPFSIVPVPFYMSPNNAKGIQFLHILANTYHLPAFLSFFLIDLRSYAELGDREREREG